MTKTDESVKTQAPGPRRGLVWAVAGLVVVVTVGGLYLAFNGVDGQVVDQTTVPTPTTALEPKPEAMTDVEIVEAGAAAVYSGDAAAAAGMFDLASSARWRLTDEEIATEAAYQEVIGGHVDLDCTEPETSGNAFDCIYRYGNSLTDAIGYVDPGETSEVLVSDGQIVEFYFPENTWVLESVGEFLALGEGWVDGYEDCVNAVPHLLSCAEIQSENVGAWADWYQSRDGIAVVQDAISSLYGGDCVAALVILAGDPNGCSGTSDPGGGVAAWPGEVAAMVQYESILDAQVSLENCESTSDVIVRCDVHYSNALNEAVGKAAVLYSKTFQVRVIKSIRNLGWHEASIPGGRRAPRELQAVRRGR